jgi:hypothetical protein
MIMKARLLFFVPTGLLVAVAAWLVHVPRSAQANEVPEKYRETVSKGLEYLAKNQCKDGHWEADGGKHPVAMTALVGMALLMECSENFNGDKGRSDSKGKYLANVEKAVDWLMSKCDAKRDGLIFSDHPSETDRYMYGHGLATQFLAWAYQNDIASSRREELKEILARAGKYITRAQSSQGGWYRTSKVEGHDFDEILATAMQIQALAAWGSDIDRVAYAMTYLERGLEKYEDGVKPSQGPGSPAETAAVLACQRFYQDHFVKKWFKYCQKAIPVGQRVQFGRDELAHYYYAQALFSLEVLPADTWTTYRTAMFDHLQSSQNKDGSWPAGGGIMAGPVFSTAVWCTVMQLDRNCHPVARRETIHK